LAETFFTFFQNYIILGCQACRKCSSRGTEEEFILFWAVWYQRWPFWLLIRLNILYFFSSKTAYLQKSSSREPYIVLSTKKHNVQFFMYIFELKINFLCLSPIEKTLFQLQHYVIKFVSDLRQVVVFSPVSSTNKTDRHDITEILLKMVINTIILTLTPMSFIYW
jgi:hypothetical protein